MRIECGKNRIECNGLKLRGNSVMVKFISGGEQEISPSGIITKDELRRYNIGEVIISSEKVQTECSIGAGAKIYFNKNCGVDYTVNGTYCLLIQSKDILGIIE